MTGTIWRMGRRALLASAAATATGLVLPGKAPAQGGGKPFQGTTLNVSCWSAPYAKWLGEYLPEFEAETGIKVNYDTPGFAVYNQRADLEFSTRGGAYDVANVTFIYSSRWIGAGWFTPLDDFAWDRNRTPAAWDAADFLPGLQAPMTGRDGKTYGFTWVADVMHAAAGRSDLLKQAGVAFPDSYDALMTACKAIDKRAGVRAFLTENHHGWIFPPIMMGFGGKVFRDPPDDLMPALDSPENAEAVDWYANLLNTYSPDGILSYTYDQATAALKAGRGNYSFFNQAFLMQMAAPDSKVKDTVAYGMYPTGPKGRFPGVAVHGWGIPVGSKNKDAAWEFIKWAVSREMFTRMLVEKGYGSVTRKSVIQSPEFTKANTVNGYDIGKIYLDTIDLARQGHMKYRTVHVYPQVNTQINKAVEAVVSGQLKAKEAWKLAQENAIADLKRAGVAL